MPDRYDSDYIENTSGVDAQEQREGGLYPASESPVPMGLDSLEDIESFVKNLEEEVAALKRGGDAFREEESFLEAQPQQSLLDERQDLTSRDDERRTFENIPLPNRTEPVSLQRDLPHAGSAVVASVPPRQYPGEKADGRSAAKREDPYAAPEKFDPWQNVFEGESRQPETTRPEQRQETSQSRPASEGPFQPRTFDFDPQKPFVPNQSVAWSTERRKNDFGEESRKAAQDLVANLTLSYQAPPYEAPKTRPEEESEPIRPDEIELIAQESSSSEYEEADAPYFDISKGEDIPFQRDDEEERQYGFDFSSEMPPATTQPAMPEITMPSYTSFDEEVPLTRAEPLADTRLTPPERRESEFAFSDDIAQAAEGTSDRTERVYGDGYDPERSSSLWRPENPPEDMRTVSPWYPKDVYTSGEEGYRLKSIEEELPTEQFEETETLSKTDITAPFTFDDTLQEETVAPSDYKTDVNFSETHLAEEIPELKENLFEEISELSSFSSGVSPYTPWEEDGGSFAAWDDSAQGFDVIRGDGMQTEERGASGTSDALFFDDFYFSPLAADKQEQELPQILTPTIEGPEESEVDVASYEEAGPSERFSDREMPAISDREMFPKMFDASETGELKEEDSLDIPFEHETLMQSFFVGETEDGKEDASLDIPFEREASMQSFFVGETEDEKEDTSLDIPFERETPMQSFFVGETEDEKEDASLDVSFEHETSLQSFDASETEDGKVDTYLDIPLEREISIQSFDVSETEDWKEEVSLDVPLEQETSIQSFDVSEAKEQPTEDVVSESLISPFSDIAKAPDYGLPSTDTEAPDTLSKEDLSEAEAPYDAQWGAAGYETLADTPDYRAPLDVLTQPEIDVIVEQESEVAPAWKDEAEYVPSPFEAISKEPKEEPQEVQQEDSSAVRKEETLAADFRNDGFELNLSALGMPIIGAAVKTEPAAEELQPKEAVDTEATAHEEELTGDIEETRTEPIGDESAVDAEETEIRSVQPEEEPTQSTEEVRPAPVVEESADKTYSLFGELVTPVVGEPLSSDEEGGASIDGIAAMFGSLDLSTDSIATSDISAMIDNLSLREEPEAELPMQTQLELPAETDESPLDTAAVIFEEAAVADIGGTPSLSDIVLLGQVKDELLEEQPDNYSFEGISDHLEAGMIVSEMQAKYSENNLLPYEEEGYLTFHDMTSIYNMKFQNGTSRPLYENLNVTIPKGSCTAFVSETPLDVHALLRATKNRAGIKDGYITVGDRRSEDSPNLLYIENDSMITFGMPALQFLMLCLSEVKDRPAAKQEKLLNMLDDVGLSQIALVDTKLLTKFQRIALLLLTVAMSNLIDGVVLNPNKLPLDMADEFVIRRIFKLLHDTGKTILIVGNNLVLTSCVANRIVALTEGQVTFDGSFPEFVEHYCDSTFSFSTKDTGFVMQLREDFTEAKYEKRGDRVTVHYTGDDTDYLTAIIARVLDEGIEGRTIATKKKSFERAIGRMVEA